MAVPLLLSVLRRLDEVNATTVDAHHDEEHHDDHGMHATASITDDEKRRLRDAKIALLALIGVATWLFSLAPWACARASAKRAMDVVNFICAVAAGVIFASFMTHMIPDSTAAFKEYLEGAYHGESKFNSYPFATMTAGAMFLLLVIVDRVVLAHATAGLAGPTGHAHHGHSHGAVLAVAKEAPPAALGSARSSDGGAAPVTVIGNAMVIRSAAAGDAPAPLAKAPSARAPADADGAVAVAVDADDGAALTSKAAAPAPPTRAEREAVVRAWIFVGAMCLHAFFDGLSLGAESTLSGFYAVLVAVIAHKFADGLATGAAIFPAGLKLPVAWGAAALAAAFTPIGIAVGLAATEGVSGRAKVLAEAVCISLSAGSFLFIAIVELLPAALQDGRLLKTKCAGLFLGFAAIAIIVAYAHADSHAH